MFHLSKELCCIPCLVLLHELFDAFCPACLQRYSPYGLWWLVHLSILIALTWYVKPTIQAQCLRLRRKRVCIRRPQWEVLRREKNVRIIAFCHHFAIMNRYIIIYYDFFFYEYHYYILMNYNDIWWYIEIVPISVHACIMYPDVPLDSTLVHVDRDMQWCPFLSVCFPVFGFQSTQGMYKTINSNNNNNNLPTLLHFTTSPFFIFMNTGGKRCLQVI